MYKKPQGFTLIEIAIALVILGVLLGALLEPFGASYSQQKRNSTEQLLRHTKQALIGFAVKNQRLPCPATESSNGAEDYLGTVGDSNCASGYGFVPAQTLGLDGAVDSEGRLLDAWNRPIRYAVSAGEASEGANQDRVFVTTGGMRQARMENLEPQLSVRTADSVCRTTKARATQLPVVLVSQGEQEHDTVYERQNREPSQSDYGEVFVAWEFSQNPQCAYDDLVVWLSENVLYKNMIEAGALP